MKILLYLLMGMLFFSCMQSEDPEGMLSGPLPIGNWSNMVYEEDGMLMKRVTRLEQNKLGYRFLPGGKLIHRTYSG